MPKGWLKPLVLRCWIVAPRINLHIDLGPVYWGLQRIIVTECDGDTFPCVLGMDFLDADPNQIDTVNYLIQIDMWAYKGKLTYTPAQGNSIDIQLETS